MKVEREERGRKRGREKLAEGKGRVPQEEAKKKGGVGGGRKNGDKLAWAVEGEGRHWWRTVETWFKQTTEEK